MRWKESPGDAQITKCRSDRKRKLSEDRLALSVAQFSQRCILPFTYRTYSRRLEPWESGAHQDNPELLMKAKMRPLWMVVLLLASAACLVGCGVVSSSNKESGPITITNAFTSISAGSAAVTLSVEVKKGNATVNWSLTYATQPCAPACGMLVPKGDSSAIYTPPAGPPTYGQATITAVSTSDVNNIAFFPFTIGPPISVSITDKFSTQMAGGANAPLLATVSGDAANAGVTWTLTAGGGDCSPGCGTLKPATDSPVLAATYEPPPVAPSGAGASPTISATSVTNPKISDSFTFSITPALNPISVIITNKFSKQFAGGGQITLTATVSADSAGAGVTWTLTAGGGACSPGCGTLTPGTAPTFTAIYQPPDNVPTGANASPTITATSVSDPSKSDSFMFSIATVLSRLQGSYALLLRGYYDVPGTPVPMALAGSVTADGNGNITAGEFDFDNGGGITTSLPTAVSGTYSIDASFNNVTRGRIVTSYVFPGSSINLAFDFVLSADGTRGRAVESDGSGYINSGTFVQQDLSALTAAHPDGTYAFGLDSDAPYGGRIVEAGRFVLAGGVISNGIVDQSKAANITPTYTAAPAQGSATNSDTSGRGTLTLTVNGDSTQYAYYIVNSSQLNMVQIDQGLKFGTVQAGVASAQKMPFTADSVNMTSVLQMTGMDAIPNTASGVGPDVIIGVLTIKSGSQFTLGFDENDLGTVLASFPPHPASGAVTFDPTTGRGTLSDPGGFESAFMDAAVFYLYDVGKGFIIDGDISTCAPPPPAVPPGCTIATTPSAAITNNAFSGTFTAQVGAPYSLTSIAGNLIAGSGASVVPDIPDMAAAVAADPVAGTLTGLGDLDSLSAQVGNHRDVPFSGSFNGISDVNLGHGFALMPPFVFGDFSSDQRPTRSASFYMIGPNQFVLIGTQSGLNSGIVFFDPQ